MFGICLWERTHKQWMTTAFYKAAEEVLSPTSIKSLFYRAKDLTMRLIVVVQLKWGWKAKRHQMSMQGKEAWYPYHSQGKAIVIEQEAGGWA